MSAPFLVTFFDHVSAKFKREQTVTIEELRNLLLKTTAPSKDLLPLVKLARFGELRTAAPKNCLRHDRNVVAITGIEGDYDAGKMSFDEASDRLKQSKIKCLLYTSPSHTPEHPRWRILCPLSRELEPARRRALVARVNGVLGGVLAPESFALSQSYYFGYVGGSNMQTAWS